MINLFLLKHTPSTSISEIILLMSYVICSSHANVYRLSSLWTYVFDLTSKLEVIMSLSIPVFHVFNPYVVLFVIHENLCLTACLVLRNMFLYVTDSFYVGFSQSDKVYENSWKISVP